MIDTAEIRRVFGADVRQARKARGLSQAELAELLTTAGVPLHQTMVSKLETGQCSTSLETVVALAVILGEGVLGRVDESVSDGR